MRIEDSSKQPKVRPTAACPVTGLGREFDPFTNPYLADPYALWKRARAEEPVFYSPEIGYWVVTRYADIKAIFADPKTFSAEIVQNPISPLSPAATAMLRDNGFRAQRAMSNADPPDHTRIRKFTWQAFTPRRVAQLGPDVLRLVTHFIDQFEPDGRADLVAQMFYDLPVLLLFIFLGMPEEDVAQVKSWAQNRLLLTWGRLAKEKQMEEAKGLLDYWKYSERHVANLLHDPPDNFVGDLIRARNGNDRSLSIDEIVTVVYGLLLAGHETTTSMAGNAIVTLLTHGEAWNELCMDPGLIPNAVEELLRYDTSVTTWRRNAVNAVEIGGVRIPEGARLLLALCSANRDGAVFPGGEELDIRRRNARDHLSFGFGIHYCLGAPLARLELTMILQELTRRLPRLRLVEGQRFEYLPNTSFRGPLHVHVEWA